VDLLNTTKRRCLWIKLDWLDFWLGFVMMMVMIRTVPPLSTQADPGPLTLVAIWFGLSAWIGMMVAVSFFRVILGRHSS